MHPRAAFAGTCLAALDGLIARDSFITMITNRGEAPTASHLPERYPRAGDRIAPRRIG